MRIKLKGLKVLDVGCGVGDFVRSFADKGAKVTGLDISDEVINVARESLEKRNGNITLLGGSIEEMDFQPASFDLVTSVTVLQHIVDEERYERAVQNMVNAARPSGHILIVERAPVTVTERQPSSKQNLTTQVLRAREEWIKDFEGRGCSLVYERGHPSFAISLLLVLQRWTWRFLYRVRPQRPNAPQPTRGGPLDRAQGPTFAARAYSLFAKGTLIPFYPFEHWLFISPPRKHAVLVYMMFQKGAA